MGHERLEEREEPRPEFIGQMKESATIGTLARRGRGETAEDVEAKEMADSWRRARNLPIRMQKFSTLLRGTVCLSCGPTIGL